MFGSQDQEAAGARTRRKAITRRPTGICVLDSNRAQNMAIVLGKIKMSTGELCDALAALDFSDTRITVDDVELVMGVLPTDEEVKKLMQCKSAVQDLRDVEQKVMPFCDLQKPLPRLKLLKFALAHEAQHSSHL